ncbi:hypothetical protein H920_06908 [Fukomys damarensis]|uniref:Uncharacterized protein n=1 Tax=Fukomys damarensis TaxID=885580 RepID=A0A091DHZ5_FUKDA|nr:hypothetical protein H920_06908 [Fukomys damarensis]
MGTLRRPRDQECGQPVPGQLGKECNFSQPSCKKYALSALGPEFSEASMCLKAPLPQMSPETTTNLCPSLILLTEEPS